MGTGDRNTMPSSGDYHAYQSVQQQTPQTRQSPARQMLQQISPRLKDFQLMVEQVSSLLLLTKVNNVAACISD